jgi:cytochrome bd-type quinol oxidase subunit 2
LQEVVKQRALYRGEVMAGAMLAGVGLVALWLALDFDAESRMFPAVTAGLLTIVGVATAALAIIRPRAEAKETRRHLGYAALASAAIGLWALAFGGGAGFVMPTLLLQLALLRLTGVRRPAYMLAVAALVTGLAWLAFIVLLQVPMPPPLVPGIVGEW